MSKSLPPSSPSIVISYDNSDLEWNYYDEPQPQNLTCSCPNASPTFDFTFTRRLDGGASSPNGETNSVASDNTHWAIVTAKTKK
ncbi:hypothetical protein FRC12_013063 [Ceratobasidium sp. 428]|nr:hypothetical protein FRC12_013063 [Ceratobasidium sp. 428]